MLSLHKPLQITPKGCFKNILTYKGTKDRKIMWKMESGGGKRHMSLIQQSRRSPSEVPARGYGSLSTHPFKAQHLGVPVTWEVRVRSEAETRETTYKSKARGVTLK